MNDKQSENKTGIGDSIDNMAAGAADAAKTAGQIAKKVGSAAEKSAKAAKTGVQIAQQSSQAASNAAASGAASSAATVAESTAAGSAGGPYGMIAGAIIGLALEFKDQIFKVLMVLGFSIIFIIILVSALPNIVFERAVETAEEAWHEAWEHPVIMPILYSYEETAIRQSVTMGYNRTVSGLASAISKEGLPMTVDSLTQIINGDGTYESGDTYLYVSDPTRMLGLDYDASYIMAAYSASMLNIPNSSDVEGVFNGVAEVDMKNKLADVEDEMFSYNVSKSTETVLVPAEYYTYSSAGTFTYVTGTEIVENEDGTTTEVKKLGQKEFFVRNNTMASADTEITIDDFRLVAVEIPVPVLNGTRYVTRYYYEKSGTRTISPTTRTLTYLNCAIGNFDEDCILKAFDINEYALFGHTTKQFWEVIESLRYNINRTLNADGSAGVRKVYSSSINGEYVSRYDVPWYRTDVSVSGLPEVEEPPERYLDSIPIFTGSDHESEKLKEFLPGIPDGTLAKTVSQGLMILYYPDGTAEKLFSSEYYTSQTSSFISPLPYDDAYCSSDYGYRMLNGTYKLHGGLDMCCWSGTLNKDVIATASGTVIYSGFNAYGNCVMIDHGNGIVSLYGHLNSRSVSEGSVVAQGQVIGLAGSTYGPGGYSTGPHLHFEIRTNEERVNPRTYVELPAYSDW